MRCSACEDFQLTVDICSPSLLDRVVADVRAATAQNILKYEFFESDRELFGQPSFLQLQAGEPWPDFMRYHFSCTRCGSSFLLEAETYHGSGGSWRQTGQQPSNPALQPTAFGRS
mgnify:CR=1 FL=1